MTDMLLIKNARIIDPQGVGERTGAILVQNGMIDRVIDAEREAECIFPQESESADGAREGRMRVVDAAGWLAFPGLIDAHVHFRDPGFTEKEDITTGAAAAGHGGFTSVIMMGNTNPPMDEPGRIEDVLARGRNAGIHVYTCGNVTASMQGRELTDFAALKRAGAVLLSDDGLPIRDAALMERACAAAAAADMAISLHEEDPAYIDQPGINCGAVSERMGFRGAERRAEIEMVARDITIAEKTGARITVQHISAKESVRLIREAKARGVQVHAEATPHHFTLTEDAVRRYGTNAKMNPPLRTEADRQAIIEGLADGTIDMIATDHAPHTKEEKEREFLQAPSGIIGLETALSLSYRELVQPEYLTWMQVIGRLTCAYKLYGLSGGTLKAGAAADITLFSPNERWIVADRLYSKACNTPFLNEHLPGVVKMTICDGNIVYEDGKGRL